MKNIEKEINIFEDNIETREEENVDTENVGEDGIDNVDHIKLDYTLQKPEERVALVEKIINSQPNKVFTNRYLEILSDYIVFAMEKEERKQKKILTDNRMVTVNKRETSFQGLASTLEGGEDSIYNMIANDKNIIFTPKVSITPEDIAEIPQLKELREAIEVVEKEAAQATGRKKFLLKKQVIQMRQDQYVLKSFHRQPISFVNATKSFGSLNLDEQIKVNEKGELTSSCIITLINQNHVSALLCNYSKLKQEVWGKFWCDSYFLMEDLDALVDRALKEDYPLYYDLLIYKIDGKQNVEIQRLLEEKHGVKHSVEYLSSLWRNKIPKLVAEKAQEEYLIWHYLNQEPGTWKKCSKCQTVKLAHNKFFSKNSSSKDGFYSICKVCRNKKK